ncbi:MAG: hypothetical protein PVF63_09365 [Gammaproteobacteria bacterium]|jgi:hypothetical protein
MSVFARHVTGFVAAITELSESVPNAGVITLDNREIRQQLDPKPHRLRPGMQVRSYPTNRRPSHRLTALTLNGFTRVQQIRDATAQRQRIADVPFEREVKDAVTVNLDLRADASRSGAATRRIAQQDAVGTGCHAGVVFDDRLIRI